MAKLSWFVLAQRVITDQRENNVSLIDVLEQLNIPESIKPEKGKAVLVPVRFFGVSNWRRSDPRITEAGQFQISMRGPSGAELAKVVGAYNLRDFQRFRSSTLFPGLPYVGPGYYSVRVSMRNGGRWKVIDEQFIEVKTVADGEATPKKPRRRTH